jgi:hypothetical protein
MILRRVIKHVRNQEWTAIFLDFIIVVVGVFVGLQVSNWNAVRKDRTDEQLFIVRLHEDIVLAESLTSRVRNRRMDRLTVLMGAADIIFARSERNMLSDEECSAVGSAHFYNIPLSDLPSLVELTSSGRVAIIRDTRLRTALVALQQTKAALASYINLQGFGAVDLPSKYPDLIQLEIYFDADMGEARSRSRCDLEKIRASQAFLNDYSENVDRYDGFVQDGLAPWSSQFKQVHRLTDAALGVDHGAEETK